MTEQNAPIRPMQPALCIDIHGATQAVLFRQTDCDFAAMPRLVLPSPSVILSRKIGACTAGRRDVYVAGPGAGRGCLDAIADHIRQGCRVAMERNTASRLYKTAANGAAAGVEILESCPDGYTLLRAEVVDLDFWNRFAATLALEEPPVVAVAALDSGDNDALPQTGNACRSGTMHLWNTILRRHAEQGAPPEAFMLAAGTAAAPPGLAALQSAVKGFVTDSGVAPLLLLLHDAEIHRRSFRRGLVLLNAGEVHITAFLVWRGHVFGVYEHHTRGMDILKVMRDLSEFRLGWLPDEAVRSDGGHGTAFADIPPEAEGFPAMYVTGQERGLFDGYGKICESPEHGAFSGCLGMACAIDAMTADA